MINNITYEPFEFISYNNKRSRYNNSGHRSFEQSSFRETKSHVNDSKTYGAFNKSTSTSKSIHKRKYRISSKTRFCTFVIIVFVITFILSGFLINNESAAGMENMSYDSITVEYGDTLWSIAKSYIEADTDIREFVNLICDVNDLDTKEIYEGQEIKIPV